MQTLFFSAVTAISLLTLDGVALKTNNLAQEQQKANLINQQMPQVSTVPHPFSFCYPCDPH